MAIMTVAMPRVSTALLPGKTEAVAAKPRTNAPTVAGTVATAVSRMPLSTSARTSPKLPAPAALDIRVNSAVTSDTVTSECGSMKMRKALLYEILPGTSRPARLPALPAYVRTREVMMKPAVETPRAANVQSATVDALRRPNPRKPHLWRNRNPDRHSGTTSTRACAATPAVALPASTQTIGEVQSATAAWCG